jgi:hypothetical protein
MTNFRQRDRHEEAGTGNPNKSIFRDLISYWGEYCFFVGQKRAEKGSPGRDKIVIPES